MTKQAMLHESQFVDLTDDQLKDAIGTLWERIGAIKEAEGNDPDLEQMKAKLKAYRDDCYGAELKEAKKKLKAARAIAHAREIRWKLPEGGK